MIGKVSGLPSRGPFCLVMIKEGTRCEDAEEELRVEDVVELVEKVL